MILKDVKGILRIFFEFKGIFKEFQGNLRNFQES